LKLRRNGQCPDDEVNILRRIVSLKRGANQWHPVPHEDRNFDLVFVVKPALKEVDVAIGQGDGDHLRVPFGRVGAERRQAGEFRDALSKRLRHSVTFGANAIPIMRALKFDCHWHAQEGGDVARALPLVLIDEGRIAGRLALPALAHHQRFEQRLPVGPRVQESRALRGAQPLVTVGTMPKLALS